MNQRLAYLLRTTLSFAILLFFGSSIVFASDVEGTLDTGLGGNGMMGIVITSPAASPAAGTFASAQSVTLTASGSSSIHYTVDGTSPTCLTGTTYSSAISVASTTTIKALSCYPSNNASGVVPFVYTISTSNNSGGGGSGGSSNYILPVIAKAPVVLIPEWDLVTPAPAAPPAPDFYDPSKYEELLKGLNLKSDPANFEKYKPIVRADAQSFGITLTNEQVRAGANFVVYGISWSTMKLGSGERRALLRDYFETVSRPDVVWSDVEKLATGQKPVKRNLAKEQSVAANVLANFKKMTGHAPDFKNSAEDLAWNTMMYRIRFPRDLAKEQQGIVKFKTIFRRSPSTPFEWSMVRALGYAL